ncbi:MAG: glycosyltransferase family 4 protein [Thermomicrobiales bacterium]
MPVTPRHIAMLGPFGLAPKATMSVRAAQLGETLAARGHRVTMILPPWDDPARSGQTWHADGVTYRHIALPRRLETAGIVHRLRSALRGTAPDVVHLFKPKGHAALAVLGLEGRYPLVVDTDDWEGAGGWNDAGGYSLAQRRLFAWQERALPRRAAAVTAASRTLETQLWGFGVSPAAVTYLPNGVTARRHGDWAAATQEAPAVRARLGLADVPVVLLYTRFVEFPPERPVALLRAVREQAPEVRLLIIGHGLQGEETTLLAEARRAGVADAIVQVPWVERAALPAHLGAADVAILPYADTPINRAKCSVKTLDLLVAGLPIVADAVGQNREYLEHNVSGVLVPPDDPAEFAPAVATLLRNPARRHELGAAAQERVWREFDWARLVTRAEAAYEQAIAQERRRDGHDKERARV